jgi:hypothetical protein
MQPVLGDQRWLYPGEVNMKTQQKKREQKGKAELGLRFDDGPLVPFEVDILAAEDFARIYRSRPLSPERELMVAVFEEALADYQRCCSARDKKGMKQFASAKTWILESDSEWIFSFINCCEALGIEPGYLRRGLLRSKQGERARPLSARAIQHQKNQPQLLRQAA